MAGDDDITIRAELEDEISQPARRGADSIDDLADSAETATPGIILLERAIHELRDEMRKARRETKGLDRDVATLGRTSTRTSRRVKEVDKRTGFFRSTLLKFKKIDFDIGTIIGAYKVPAIAFGINLLAGAVSALGAAGFAAVAGLAPLGALIATYPAIMAAGAQGLAAVKMGFSGMGKAIKALNDPNANPETIAAAMKNLSPAARRLAVDLAELNDGPLKMMKRRVQQAMAPGFRKGLKGVSDLLPTVRKNLVETGGVIGELAAQAGKWLGTQRAQRQIGRIMKTNTGVIRSMGHAGFSLGKALLDILDAFRPVLMQMASYARQGAKFIEITTQQGKASGRLGAFFQRAWDLAKRVAGVLTDIVVGLFNIGRQGMGLANTMGTGIEDVAAKFRAWTESAKGQNSIKKFFDDAKPVIIELAKLVRDVAIGFGGMGNNVELAPLIHQIRTELLPDILRLVDGVSGAFGPAFIEAADAFVNFANALSFSPLAAVLKTFATLVNLLAEGVTKLPTPLNNMLATALALSLGMRGAAFTIGKVSGGFEQTYKTGKSAVGAFKKVKDGLGRLRDGYQNAGAAQSAFSGKMGSLGGQLKKLRQTAFVTKMLNGMKAAAAMTGGAFRAMWAAMTGPVGLVILAVLAVIAIGILLYKKWAPFRNLVNSIRDHVIAFAKIAWVVLKQFISNTVGMFRGLWKAIKFVWSLVTGYIKLQIKIWVTVFNGVKTAILAVWDGIKEGIGAVVDWISEKIGWVTGKMEKVGKFIGKLTPGFDVPGVPLLFAGGEVAAGSRAITGEIGPELFIPKIGGIRVVGADGPELTKFNQPGTVVSNIDSARLMAAAQMRELQPVAAEAPSWRGGDTYESHRTFVFPNAQFSSDVNLEKTIKKVVKDMEQEEEERSTKPRGK